MVLYWYTSMHFKISMVLCNIVGFYKPYSEEISAIKLNVTLYSKLLFHRMSWFSLIVKKYVLIKSQYTLQKGYGKVFLLKLIFLKLFACLIANTCIYFRYTSTYIVGWFKNHENESL